MASPFSLFAVGMRKREITDSWVTRFVILLIGITDIQLATLNGATAAKLVRACVGVRLATSRLALEQGECGSGAPASKAVRIGRRRTRG